MFAELIEGNYVLYQGDLSTNRLLLETLLVRESRRLKTGRMRPVMARKPAYHIHKLSSA
jgi:hypothetical protein